MKIRRSVFIEHKGFVNKIAQAGRGSYQNRVFDVELVEKRAKSCIVRLQNGNRILVKNKQILEW